MVARGAIVEHPAGRHFAENFRQNNASPLLVTFRLPYNKLEGVLKRDFAGNSSQDNAPKLQKYFPTPL